MITDPETGQEEPAVYFDYAYNPGLAGFASEQDRMGLPPYRECSDYRTGNRTGNNFIVRTVLPQSVATRLEHAVRENPTYARQLAEQVVLSAGGVSQEAWNQGARHRATGNRYNRMKPPYESLPGGHQIFILEPMVNKYGGQAYLASPL
jgi:hypothetical protein